MPTLCSLFPMKLVVYFQIMNLKFEVGINQQFGGFIAAIEEVGGMIYAWRLLTDEP